MARKGTHTILPSAGLLTLLVRLLLLFRFLLLFRLLLVVRLALEQAAPEPALFLLRLRLVDLPAGDRRACLRRRRDTAGALRRRKRERSAIAAGGQRRGHVCRRARRVDRNRIREWIGVHRTHRRGLRALHE